MKRRRISVIVEVTLVVLLIASVCGCSFRLIPVGGTSAVSDTASTSDSPAAQTTVYGETKHSGLLFWEVTDPDGPGKLYLLGSIHVADDTIYPFPDVISIAFNESSSLAVEVDIIALENDLSALTELSKLFVYPNMGKITDHMPSDLYEKSKKFLKDAGYYSPAYDYMLPMVWSNIIDEVNVEKSGLSADYGVDRYFLKLAKEQNKNIVELETAYDQYTMLLSFPDALAYMIIDNAVDDSQEQIDSLLEMYRVWKTGDFDEFSRYITEEPDGRNLTEEELAMYNEYNYKLLDERNAGMTAKAEDLIESGDTCFYIVGAAHMVGDSGLISQLIKAGYGVTQR